MTWQTHTVFNQPNPLSNSNLYLSDTPLQEAVARELGRMANANPPELLRYRAAGRRVDEVRFHPSWHMLMRGLKIGCITYLGRTMRLADLSPHAQRVFYCIVRLRLARFVR